MQRPDQAALQRSRRTEKQQTERLRRARRELERELIEYARRHSEPRNDSHPLPRLD